MLFARPRGLTPIGGALLLLAMINAVPASAGDQVDARFEIYGFAGLHVLTNRTSVDETPSGYGIAMELDTRGLASAFVDMRSHSEVAGALTGDAVHPSAYRADVSRNGTTGKYGVKYNKDGSVVDDSPLRPASAAGAPHIDPAQLRGTVDQLTAYFMVERQLAKRGTCKFDVSVFDGSELYRLQFSDAGQQNLAADRWQSFSGTAQLCEIKRTIVVASPSKDEGTYQSGRIWYARLLSSGDRLIPVRMEYDTVFGSVTGYLASLSGPGIHLQLTGE
jgi:flagellin-like protein